MDNAAARESRPLIFSASINTLESSLVKMEDFANRVEGVPGVGTMEKLGDKHPVPCVKEIMESYPDRIRKAKERIDAALERLESSLF